MVSGIYLKRPSLKGQNHGEVQVSICKVESVRQASRSRVYFYLVRFDRDPARVCAVLEGVKGRDATKTRNRASELGDAHELDISPAEASKLTFETDDVSALALPESAKARYRIEHLVYS